MLFLSLNFLFVLLSLAQHVISFGNEKWKLNKKSKKSRNLFALFLLNKFLFLFTPLGHYLATMVHVNIYLF